MAATSFAIHAVRMQLQEQERQAEKTPFICTCGAQAFRDQRHQDRQRQQLKRVSPIDNTTIQDDAMEIKKLQAQGEQDTQPVTRKRSLWRKILGKAPKCICEQLQRERDAIRLKPIAIPSEYEGCVTVRVAGKQVAYTREMQLIKRRSYTPMDAISEDED